MIRWGNLSVLMWVKIVLCLMGCIIFVRFMWGVWLEVLLSLIMVIVILLLIGWEVCIMWKSVRFLDFVMLMILCLLFWSFLSIIRYDLGFFWLFSFCEVYILVIKIMRVWCLNLLVFWVYKYWSNYCWSFLRIFYEYF